MPRLRRRLRQRTELTPEAYNRAYSNWFLQHGKTGSVDDFVDEFFPTRADERAFYREHCGLLLRLIRPGESLGSVQYHFGHRAGERHILWWRNEALEPRDQTVPEWWQLAHLQELTGKEVTLLYQQTNDRNTQEHSAPHLHQFCPFRRSSLWWWLLSPTPRDEAVSEAAQILRMNVTTSLEREIVVDPKKACCSYSPLCSRTQFYYLSIDELELLGLAEHHDMDFYRDLEAADAEPAGIN